MNSNMRLGSVDALRGGIMIIMALDHVRDMFHNAAASFSPTDLDKTTPILFFTRWITHFCAPVFMFTAGVGAFLWWQRGRSLGQLSRFLWTRGLWLIVLELTVMRLAHDFSFSMRYPILLLPLWALGSCMVLMAALVRIPIGALAGLSIAVIALHNCLDGIDAARFGSAAWVWSLVHLAGPFSLGKVVVVAPYPLVPWFAVMAAGFCFGKVLLMEPAARQRIARNIGLGAIAAFVAIRAVNVYGDPGRWAVQRSGTFTVLSFLNTVKYPPSLDFLLMTLGPALLALAFLDRLQWKAGNPLVVVGRVPLFFFVIHFYAIHLLAAAMAWIQYGNARRSGLSLIHFRLWGDRRSSSRQALDTISA